jgi:hypothetical protein
MQFFKKKSHKYSILQLKCKIMVYKLKKLKNMKLKKLEKHEVEEVKKTGS